ncbi:MAG: methylamine utilization protein [Burkholderiaceae bacterium]
MAAVFSSSAVAATLGITVVGSNDRPIVNAAVSLLVKGAAASNPQATARLTQRNRTFAPAVLVVQTGTAVSFPNEDTVRHHVYSFSTINPFEIKLYVGLPASPVVFDKPGTAVLGCNIHDQMVGYIHVVDTPHFAVTDERGIATLEVPPGDHRLRTWHPDLGPEAAPVDAPVKVSAEGATRTVRLAVD